MAEYDRLIIWVVASVLALISVILLSGHGQGLIAGYNTAPKEEKDKIDEKKLARVVGFGTSIITLLLVILASFLHNLPSFFIPLFIILVISTAVVVIILSNTITKKK